MSNTISQEMFTSTERQVVEAMAKERGFKSLREYMRSLVEIDAQQHGNPAPFEEDDELDDPVDSFRRAWGEAMRGEGMSREEFRRRMLRDED